MAVNINAPRRFGVKYAITEIVAQAINTIKTVLNDTFFMCRSRQW
jgi:hypothetical protein